MQGKMGERDLGKAIRWKELQIVNEQALSGNGL